MNLVLLNRLRSTFRSAQEWPHLLQNPLSRHLIQLNRNGQAPFPAQEDAVHIRLCLAWLCHAQDVNPDGGFSAKYSVKSPPYSFPSYPETTGYIIPSLLAAAEVLKNPSLLDRARRAALWLLSLQAKEGYFPAGHAGWQEQWGKPSVFNTGQILLGLAALQRSSLADDRFAKAAERGAAWMVSALKSDGSFNNSYSFFPDRSYYIQATYGLAVTGDLLGRGEFLNGAHRNLERVLARHHEDGWIDQWGFEADKSVLHSIVYTLRGIFEVATILKDEQAYKKLIRSLEKLLSYKSSGANASLGLLPSHFREHWSGNDQNLCLTGLAQLAVLLFKTAEVLQRKDDYAAAIRILESLKRYQLQGFNDPHFDGGMQGSWPIWGDYQPWDLINWGPKFFLDALLLKMKCPISKIY